MMSMARRERHWMSSMAYKTPAPPRAEDDGVRAASEPPPPPASLAVAVQAVDAPTLQLPSIRPRAPFQPAVSARPAEPAILARPHRHRRPPAPPPTLRTHSRQRRRAPAVAPRGRSPSVPSAAETHGASALTPSRLPTPPWCPSMGRAGSPRDAPPSSGWSSSVLDSHAPPVAGKRRTTRALRSSSGARCWCGPHGAAGRIVPGGPRAPRSTRRRARDDPALGLKPAGVYDSLPVRPDRLHPRLRREREMRSQLHRGGTGLRRALSLIRSGRGRALTTVWSASGVGLSSRRTAYRTPSR